MADDTIQTTPKRIQRRRTKGWRSPPDTIYVGRGSRWGNPYKIGTCLIADAQCAVDAFRANLPLHFACAELRGKNLSCWCPLVDKDGNRVPCHADILLEIANA